MYTDGGEVPACLRQHSARSPHVHVGGVALHIIALWDTLHANVGLFRPAHGVDAASDDGYAQAVSTDLMGIAAQA